MTSDNQQISNQTKDSGSYLAVVTWLRFAESAIAPERLVDINGDGTADGAFEDVVSMVRNIIDDSDATIADLEYARALSQAIVLETAVSSSIAA